MAQAPIVVEQRASVGSTAFVPAPVVYADVALTRARLLDAYAQSMGYNNLNGMESVRRAQQLAELASGGTYPFKTYQAFISARRGMYWYRPDPSPQAELNRIIAESHRIESATGVAVEKVWEDERWDINNAGGRLILYGVGLGLAGLGAGIAAGVAIGGTAGGPYGAVIGAGVGVTVGIVLAVFPFRQVQLLADYRTMLDLMTPIERWPLYCQTRRLVSQARGLNRLAPYPGDWRYGNYGNYNITGGAEAAAFLLGEALFETDSMIQDIVTPRSGPSANIWDDNPSNRWCALWAVGDLPDELQINQSRYFNKAATPGHANGWIAGKLRAFGTMTAGEFRQRVSATIPKLTSLDTLPDNGTALELAVARNTELRTRIAAHNGTR